MKALYKYTLLTLTLVTLLSLAACSDKDNYAADGDLKASIAIAENLIGTTEEGTNEGDFAPGSQKTLQARIDWARFILDTRENEEAVVTANKTLLADIEIYKVNKVKAGYPEYGMSSSFDLGSISTYPIGEDFTIQFRARFKDLSGNNLFTAEDETGGIIMRYGGSNLQAYVHNGGWVGGDVNFVFQANIWYDLAMVYNGQNVKFYVDGVEKMSATGSRAKVNVKPGTKIKVGTHPTYAGRWFAGNVYKISIWDYPKTAGEIVADKAIDFSGNESGLLAYWPMNLNLGLTIEDKTGKYTANGNQISWIDID